MSLLDKSSQLTNCCISLWQYHPDANQNDPKSHAQFIEIQRAYSILSTPSKRYDYDVSLKGPYQTIIRRRAMDPTDDSKYYEENFSDEFKDFYYRR